MRRHAGRILAILIACPLWHGALSQATVPYSISSVHRDSASLLAGATQISIAGRITIATGVLDTLRLSVFVQDATGGIQAYGSRIDQPARLGDSVVVTGVVKPYRGVLELADATLTVVPGTRRLVVPAALDRPNSQTLAVTTGCLVTLTGRVTGARVVSGSTRLRLSAPDAPSGRGPMVSVDAGDDDFGLDRFSVGDLVEVTGVLSRRDERRSPTAEYMVLVADAGGVRRVGFTANQRKDFLLALVPVLLALGLVWTRLVARGNKRQLRAVEERFHALYDDSADAVLVLDAARRITEANIAAAALTALSPEALRGRTLLELFADSDAELVSRTLRDALAHGSVDCVAHLHRPPTGCVDVSLRVAVIPNGRDHHTLAVIRDLSAQRQLEAQLRQAQKMEAVGQLAGGVAHDFNNLLTVILMHCELLAAQFVNDPAVLPDVLVIKDAGERAAGLTRQLLAYSRKQLLQPQALDLNRVTNDIALMLRGMVGDDVALTLDLSHDVCCVRADPGQLGQVLMNLAVNARDAMPDGGQLVIATAVMGHGEVRTHLGTPVPEGDYVLLCVSDSGIGMSAEVQERAFEPFFTTKPLGGGTGLGLATTYGIIHQSGGFVALESRVGHGTSVRIFLPKDTAAIPAADGAPKPISSGSETILFVEDEDAVRALAERVLRQAGFTVLSAPSGTDAIELAEAHLGQIDTLVTDVVMAGMSGRELHARLAASGRCRHVLYISGYTDDEILRRGLETRTMPYLEKPFTGAQLVERVRAVLDARQ